MKADERTPIPLFAHTPPEGSDNWHRLDDHLRAVAELAAQFGAPFGAGDEARLAGLLHDAGKAGDLFQKRLRGQASNVDHWSPGAWAAITRYRNLAVAMAVQGHHQGLRQVDKNTLRLLDPGSWGARHPDGPALSVDDPGRLLDMLHAAGLDPADPHPSIYGKSIQQTASAMLDIRMLFSALVDADFLDTERHFNHGQARRAAPSLEPGAALQVVRQHVEGLAKMPGADPELLKLRSDLFQACLSSAGNARQPGLFTLTAPTGAGKTLAMLAFALRHAQQVSARRLIFVLPFLSIIEQTARVYRDLLGPSFGEDYVVEHHSLTGTRSTAGQETVGEGDAVAEKERRQRLMAENWDAPVIITTSVQLLESLFANRPGACRKLHRLASSVILFDEVQTLPLSLAIATLKTLSRLTAGYRASVVFATATQPAFETLSRVVREDRNTGWAPAEIASPELGLFGRIRRTSVTWPGKEPTSWEQLADTLALHPRDLCVVNLKRHAAELTRLLRERGVAGVRHISTNLCPAHRQRVLNEIRQTLENGESDACRLVATQCVEAGVDVDFPVLYRAMGPLEAIAQAAGRCNRNGRLETGQVVVFRPEDEAYPPGAYAQAAAVTWALLSRLGPDAMDIDDPELFARYYTEMYDIARPETHNRELRDAIAAQDFEAVAREYRIIAADAINILVPYDEAQFESLCHEAEQKGVTGSWQRRARPFAVSVFRPRPADPIRRYLKPVPVVRGGDSDEWFIYLDPAHYDRETDLGLVVPDESQVLIA